MGEVSSDSYIELIKQRDEKTLELQATKELAFRMKKFSLTTGFNIDDSHALKYWEAFQGYSPSLRLNTISELQDEIYMVAEGLEKAMLL